MDFYIVSGTKSGSVQSMEVEGKDHDYQLYFGPYVLDNLNTKRPQPTY